MTPKISTAVRMRVYFDGKFEYWKILHISASFEAPTTERFISLAVSPLVQVKSRIRLLPFARGKSLIYAEVYSYHVVAG